MSEDYWGKPLPEWVEAYERTGFVGCDLLHPGTTCFGETLSIMKRIARSCINLYIMIHGLPIILFKRKELRNNPLKTLKTFFVNSFRSICFMIGLLGFHRYGLCFVKNLMGKYTRSNVVITSFFSCFALLFQVPHRRVEITLFTIPRCLSGVWAYLKKKNLITPLPYGEVLLFAVSMAIIMYCYQFEEKKIKHSYLSIFKKFWGKN